MSLHDAAPEAARTPEEIAQVRPVFEQVADRWTVMILTLICTEPFRFNEIRRGLKGITPKALADALGRLERNGLISRTVIPTKPIGVSYAVTPLGDSLRGPFGALYDWALENRVAMETARTAYDARQAEDRAA